jgi:hypothetical protein
MMIMLRLNPIPLSRNLPERFIGVDQSLFRKLDFDVRNIRRRRLCHSGTNIRRIRLQNDPTCQIHRWKSVPVITNFVNAQRDEIVVLKNRSLINRMTAISKAPSKQIASEELARGGASKGHQDNPSTRQQQDKA